MTTRELKRLTRLWQRRLRLSDWNVEAHLVSQAEMTAIAKDDPNSNENTLGLTQPEPSEMRAAVWVVDGDEAEATLVHELLHLRLLPFDGDDHEAKEQAINIEADCHLRAHPKRKPKKEKA